MEKQNFYDLNFDQLKIFLIEKVNVENNKANMRAQQMFNAVYKNNIKNFDELTTLSLDLREKIKKLISLAKPKIIDIQKSKKKQDKIELKEKNIPIRYNDLVKDYIKYLRTIDNGKINTISSDISECKNEIDNYVENFNEVNNG